MPRALLVPALLASTLAVACDAGLASSPAHVGKGTGGEGTSSGGTSVGGNVSSGGTSAGSGGGAGMGGSVGAGGGSSAQHLSPNGYYVSGNTIYAHDGTPHLFHGLDRPSLEWSEQGENLYASDYQLMAGWGANVVRIALNQGFWLRTAGYPATVDQQVTWAEDAGMDVILDLHWSDRDMTSSGGLQRMADESSKTFWQQVATRYKGDGRVQFELYNEPHDVPWNVWKSGGPSGDGFTVVGMQELYDTVRAAGAENLVIIGGLDSAYDLRGVPANRVTGYNIAYATHPYDFSNKQPSNWQTDWGFLAATDPIIVTEFGVTNGSCATSYYSALLDFADSLHVSWTGWAWYVKDCSFPALITDWNGDPTAAGAVIKARLGSY
jgi:endoglucanase